MVFYIFWIDDQIASFHQIIDELISFLPLYFVLFYFILLFLFIRSRFNLNQTINNFYIFVLYFHSLMYYKISLWNYFFIILTVLSQILEMLKNSNQILNRFPLHEYAVIQFQPLFMTRFKSKRSNFWSSPIFLIFDFSLKRKIKELFHWTLTFLFFNFIFLKLKFCYSRQKLKHFIALTVHVSFCVYSICVFWNYLPGKKLICILSLFLLKCLVFSLGTWEKLCFHSWVFVHNALH